MENNKSKAKSNREDKSGTAKLQEQIDKIIKSLGSGSSTDEKISLLAKNFIELERENNRQGATMRQSEKVLEKEQREKEHLQREYNKSVLVRDKLEQVCREQQKLMKSIKSESMSKIRDEEEKRKETQAHFQKSINDIFATLGKNNDENLKMKEANVEMSKKFKYLSEQYEIREKQLEKLNEQINLESQLNDAKLAKAHVESTIEKEILLKEKQKALGEVLTTKKTLVELEQRENLLKQQLNLYTSKYDQFQSSLQKSNDMFGTYKSELDKMAKRIKQLEKEAYEWRSKYEKCNRAMLNMVTDKQAQDEYVQRSARQLAQLQKLCRTLQADRTTLLECLQANNIERPPMPELPPEPLNIVAPPKPTDKLDVMTENCKELKQTLANLQNQINSIRVDGSESGANNKGKSDATAAAGKKGKSKATKTKRTKAKTVDEPKVDQVTPNDNIVSSEQQETVTSPEAVENEIVEENGADTNGAVDCQEPDNEGITEAVTSPDAGPEVATLSEA